jgi:YggT family protein
MYALNIYIWILIAAAVYSWLYAFNVINSHNQFVGSIGTFLYRVTEPVLAPIRRRMPDLGGVDISPIVVFILIYLIQRLIVYYLYPLFL